MGARFRLKAGVDISQFYPQARIIAQAMKDYGMIVADNGSNFFFSGASYSVDASNGFALTFDDNDIQDSTHGLKSLHYSDFEVVDLTPAVTGLSSGSGPVGTTVTVTGRNFSGAAGHLQVLFGSTPATNVTVVDDSHVTAMAPVITGTVDVRVQSGVNAPGNSGNIKNPIFGYGTSPTTAADLFNETPNTPPTVATPAAATPASVTGTTTALSVLGADDAGEANLKYTWALLTGPASAQPVFSGNGTNAAKNTTVTFNRAGAYTFRVTLTDAGGLTATGNVTVTVAPTLTRIFPSPVSMTVAPGGSSSFSATAADQFGAALAQQPTFTWLLLSGPGSITGAGLYTAPNQLGVTATVQVTAGGVSAQATATVLPAGFVLQGSTLTIAGGGPNDAFRFVAGPLNQVTLNGFTYQADPTMIHSFVFNGQGGNTAAVLTGGSGAEQLSLQPATALLTGPGYTVSVTGTPTITVNGGAGDVAYLFDSAGNDTFIGTPTYATFSGTGFRNTAAGFPQVSAFASAGADVALLFDGPGSDLFIATPTYAYLQAGASLNVVSGFDQVRGTSSGGGDLALLFDSAGNDVFVAYPTYSYLAGTGFLNLAAGFAQVRASSTGGTDAAFLYDSAGDDLFRSTAAYSFLGGTGFLNLVTGFTQVNAYAGSGGNDTADLYDSPGNDYFSGQGVTGSLVGPGSSRTVNRFDVVRATSSAGGLDQLLVGSISYSFVPIGNWH
jgi:hypothetical protein